jgi:AcrR family transcriptional regulator
VANFTRELQTQYVQLVASGKLRYKAAEAVGVTLPTIKRHYETDAVFRDAVDDAQEQANEPVENALYEAAVRGEPWAVKEWLSKRDRARWGDDKSLTITHQGALTLNEGGVLPTVQALVERLQARQLREEILPGPAALPIEAFSREEPLPMPVKPPGRAVVNPKRPKSSTPRPKRPGT